MITKLELDKLAEKYETADFISADPIQFPHKFSQKKDIEIAGFLASLFAFGSRKIFIQKLNTLFQIMENRPLDYLLNGNFKQLSDFNYRFAKPNDVIEILKILKKLYESSEGLEELFNYGYNIDKSIKSSLLTVTDYFYSNTKTPANGFNFMIANPKNGGAMKRMNMFLRWMIRKSEVDLGLWNIIPKSELLIPLDVHVSNVSRKMGLLTRTTNDFKAVLELTSKLREYDANDPIKYDFAMFGVGVEGLYKD